MIVNSKINSVVVLAGGVGAARFLRALALVHNQQATTALVNTGDDTILHGLNISPDIDTVIYTLGEAIDACPGDGFHAGQRGRRAQRHLEHTHPAVDQRARQRHGIFDTVDHQHRNDGAVIGEFKRVHGGASLRGCDGDA